MLMSTLTIIMAELDSRYNHKEEEEKTYTRWEESGFFNPDNCIKEGIADPNKEPFSIVLPPPNVTGILHMGHAAMLAIEDILVRYARMNHRPTIWVPGTDHAAIATQSKVESLIIKKEDKNRHDLGREEFLRRVNEFAKESHDTIVKQVKSLGASLDWSQEAYTLDEERNLAVRTAFKKMYDMGLIYRGDRLVNWDPKLQTTVSDDEIEWLEEKIPFYYLKYGPFVIGTSRPETKFGDKYVVMHPEDERYKEYKSGQKIELEWINGPITATVIKDKIIDMTFGTGVMTITPWHDATDFDIAERHNLDKEQIIDLYGKLLPVAGEFATMKIKKAREAIVQKLEKKGLVEKVEENYLHRVATNGRSGGVIEPQIMRQWFVDVNKKFHLLNSKISGISPEQEISLKELMRHTVEQGLIKITPERFEKIYFHWIDNLRDWCISRQIWFGHRIPVWYKDDEIWVDINPPKGNGWTQDEDTLDTWFSSGLWTMSTLGWPKETEDLKMYHPTSLLETGYDILFFWVARMVLMTGCILGDIPFKQVYLHGLVRDEKGKKMSKSLGNAIDPLEMSEKYGADATRLSLIIGAAPGNDIKLSEDKIRGYRNFTTKIWNVARFVLMNQPENYETADISGLNIGTSEERAYLDEFEKLKLEITAHIENMELHLAGEKLYHYFWHTLADQIVEALKPKLKSENEAEKKSAYKTLETLLLGSLKLLHPFMPFVTEEIWDKFKPGELLMVEKW